MTEDRMTNAAASTRAFPWRDALSRPELWLLVALVTVAYSPVFRGGFVWDDLVLVKRNPLATGELKLWSIWFQGDFPLSTVALYLQWLLWGDFAPGYHVVNVALHALNTILLWRVLHRATIPGAWLGAALFAVHPVGVASVAWISELKNTLSLAFFLASVRCYLECVRTQTRYPGRAYLVALLAFALSLLSKTSTVMLPVLLLLGRWWHQGSVTRRDAARLAPFFALALGFGLLTIWFQKHQVIGDTLIASGDWSARLQNAGAALWFYLGKALAPLNLCMIYPRWELTGLQAWLPGVAWLALLGVALSFRRGRGSEIFLGLTGFTVLLLPVLGFLDMYFFALSRVSDHLQYLPLTCITVMLGAGLARRVPPHLLRGVAVLLLAGLSVLTFLRASVFATDEGLWRDTLAKNPSAWNAHNNIGCLLAEQGDLAGAMRSFESSLKYNPSNAQAHVNLGRALAAQGSLALAEEHFRAAQRLRPADPDSYLHYGQALANAGKLLEAIAQLRAAANLKSSAAVHLQLAGLYRATGQPREAIACSRAALKTQPASAEALSNLSWLLATTADSSLRNGAEAIELARRACELTKFKDPQLLGTLAAAQAEMGDFTNAVRQAEAAVALAQSSGDAQSAAMNQQLLRFFRAGRPIRER